MNEDPLAQDAHRPDDRTQETLDWEAAAKRQSDEDDPDWHVGSDVHKRPPDKSGSGSAAIVEPEDGSSEADVQARAG